MSSRDDPDDVGALGGPQGKDEGEQDKERFHGMMRMLVRGSGREVKGGDAEIMPRARAGWGGELGRQLSGGTAARTAESGRGLPRSRGSHARELAVLEGGHAGGGLELAAEGGLVAEAAVERDAAERVVGVAEALGGGLDADAGEELAGGDLQEGAHEALEAAERQVGLRDEFADAQRFVVVLLHVVDGPGELAEARVVVGGRLEVARDPGDGDDAALAVADRDLVGEIPADAAVGIGDHLEAVVQFAFLGNDAGVLLLVAGGEQGRKDLGGGASDELVAVRRPGRGGGRRR